MTTRKQLTLHSIGMFNLDSDLRGEESILRRGVLFVADTDDDVRTFANSIGEKFRAYKSGAHSARIAECVIACEGMVEPIETIKSFIVESKKIDEKVSEMQSRIDEMGKESLVLTPNETKAVKDLVAQSAEKQGEDVIGVILKASGHLHLDAGEVVALSRKLKKDA